MIQIKPNWYKNFEVQVNAYLCEVFFNKEKFTLIQLEIDPL